MEHFVALYSTPEVVSRVLWSTKWALEHSGVWNYLNQATLKSWASTLEYGAAWSNMYVWTSWFWALWSLEFEALWRMKHSIALWILASHVQLWFAIFNIYNLMLHLKVAIYLVWNGYQMSFIAKVWQPHRNICYACRRSRIKQGANRKIAVKQRMYSMHLLSC